MDMTRSQAPVLEILREARALIADPSHWIKGAMFQRADGTYIYGDVCVEPTCFCSLGAVLHASLMLSLEGFKEPAIDTLAPFMKHNVVQFNDRRTHGAVLAAFDQAIAASEAA